MKRLPIKTLLLIGLLLFQPGQRLRAEQADTLIQLFNNPVQDVLATYEQLTGRKVLKESNLHDSMISIQVTEPITRAEAVELIESTLLLHGYTLVPGPGESVKVISLVGGINPRSHAIRVFSDAEMLPPGAQIVSYLMRLRYLPTDEALPLFTQQFAPTQPFGSILAVPNMDALLITESAAAIREMIHLQGLIDVPPSEVAAHFVTLTRANADRVVETIQTVLGERTSRPAGGTGGEGASPLVASGSAARLFGEFGHSGPVEFASDSRTNRVIVICNPVYFPYFERFVQSFDMPAEVAPTSEFKLRYVAAADVLSAVASALREGRREDDDEVDPTDTLTTGRDRTGAGGTGTGFRGGSDVDVIGTVAEREDRMLPVTVTVGNTRLIADQRNNAIIALGPPESMERIQSVIERLDKPPMQVYLSIVIVELDLADDLEYGVDIIARETGNRMIGSSVERQPLSNPLNLQRLLTPPENQDGIAALASMAEPAFFGGVPGLTLYGTFDNAVDILLSALETTTRVKVLGRPTVYTSNNKKAVISVGEEIPVPKSTISTVDTARPDTTALTSTIEYKDVLLQLEVVPLVNADDEVTLEIAQRNDELGEPNVISGTTVRSVRTQQIKTSVTVPDRHTIVIGGLITEREEDRRHKVPILGDIPLLGLAFSGTRRTMQRKELLLLIQPQIIQNHSDLFRADAMEKQRIRGMESTELFIQPPLPLPTDPDFPTELELEPYR